MSTGLADRVGRRLKWVGWCTAAIGAVVVFISVGFLVPVFSGDYDLAHLALVNGPLVAAYTLGVGLLIDRHSSRHLRRALGWAREGRAPDVQEHRLALGLAWHVTKIDAAAWVVGAIVFFVLNGVVESWGFAALAGATIWAGAETTCALHYLVAERTVRPVTALALAARPAGSPVGPGVRLRLVMAWLLGTGVPLLALLTVGIVGAARPGVNTSYVAGAVIFLGAIASVVGLITTVFAAKAIAEPVVSVRAGLERVESGDLGARVPVDDGSEVGLLQAGFNRMAEGLAERERLRDLFGRHVGQDVARAALRDGTRLGGEERMIGALFVDLVGSTSMALAMPPTEVVRVLNRFFRVVVEVVEAEGGLVNKFEGDAALCVFGAPVAREDPAGDALRAARELAARLARDVPAVDFGIGISAGEAVAGNVGAEHRLEYTVIGDPVNEAARLAELAKQRAERVLASDAALRQATPAEAAAWTGSEPTFLRGRAASTGVAHPRS
jgi:adenylate cyclase